MTDTPRHERMLSPAVEDYLKAIYKLEQQGGGAAVSTSALAEALGLAPASVTNMAKRLDAMGLAAYASYQGVTLTAAGEKIALEIIRHHRLLELYLREVMGYSWAELHDEAERLEHHISEAFESKLDEMLGHPTRDPHGHPIPARDGTIARVAAVPLAHAEAGERLTIAHLSDSDPALLDHLEARGLLPGATLEVTAAAPFDGPLTVRIGGGEAQVIGRAVAQSVFVEPAGG